MTFNYKQQRNLVCHYFYVVKQLGLVDMEYGQVFRTSHRFGGVSEQFIDFILIGSYPYSEQQFYGVKYGRT